MSPDAFRAALRRAERHLAAADPVLGRHIRRSPRCDVVRPARFRPFDALLSAITHQQLNGRAAATILGRVKDRFGAGGWPAPDVVARARLPALRACGLSRAKALALKDLAAKTLDGTVPPARALHRLPDEAVVERLTQVRGVGRWTVEMLLLFRLGRLDVLPVDDFGVRKGFTLLYGRGELVTPKALLAAGEPWRPYRSVASWYLWRVLDE